MRRGLLTLLFVVALNLRADERHWSFHPPARPRVPPVRGTAWVRNPIDAFMLAKLEAAGQSPAAEADRRTLIRRLTFDLNGLPPTSWEVEAFVNDTSLNAYERVVARLLASPRYGERWAQHWLDVVRFAETNGYELDGDRPQAWRYRDWVVRALNHDKAYDRFLVEQIAGDEVDPNDFELRVATGFLRAGPRHVVGGNLDPRELRQEWLTEAVQGLGSAVLGLTVQCARCHDHKFDPIPQADFYRLQAFFAGTTEVDFSRPTAAEQATFDNATKTLKSRLKPIQDDLAVIEKPYREKLRQQKYERLDLEFRQAFDTPATQRTPQQHQLAKDAQRLMAVSWDEVVAVLTPHDKEKRAGLRNQLHALERQAPVPLPAAPGVGETLTPRPVTHVLVRGEYTKLGERVEPGIVACLGPIALDQASNGTVQTRLRLADWLAQPGHPLTSRVMVNRLWQHHFGKGLVATPNDFGRNGRPPSHPELLDWLATEFVDQGWRLKPLHWLMVTSSAYRQQQPPRRLDAEALRDAMLAVAGTLNDEIGGPAVRVPLEPEVYDQIFTEGEPDNLWPVTPDPRQHLRRSLYLLHKRNVKLPMLAVFDQPDLMSSCAARGQSVHALQALTLLNSDFVQQQSTAFARRMLRINPAERIDQLHQIAFGRAASSHEREATQRFLREQSSLHRRARSSEAELAAWSDLCLATLNRNAFAYLR